MNLGDSEMTFLAGSRKGRISMIGKQVVHGFTQLLKKDVATYEHSIRVGSMAKIMATCLQFDEVQTYKLIAGCCLHDIGKVLIPDSILKKHSSLTPEEWEAMKHHPFQGVQMAALEGLVDQDIVGTIHFHHERWNGSGYPSGLKGLEIPVYARICSIIDAFQYDIRSALQPGNAASRGAEGTVAR